MTFSSNYIIFFRRISLLAITILLTSFSYADCVKDLSGEVFCGAGRCVIGSSFDYDNKYGTVWCSKYYKGGAVKTLDGRVVCGKGDCAKNSDGEVFCSSIISGSVLKDSKGNVRCYGNCERATLDNCENTVAESSGSR